ncbi:MAG: RHS repeat-associated core domain-containing protein, partial [Flavobacteriales bacterium]|nr:RHS repeat-associated core domain-containing protein [Flavobacteriales bacterium]
KKKYFGPIEYLDEQLEAIYHDHGRITDVNGSGNFQFEYNIKDHLGNIRVTFADLNDNGEIESTEVLQTNEFYPFGMKMETGSALIGSENKYQYNGKEMVNDFGLDWLDYGARWYDPAIAKWHVIDPLAEQFESWSPYNYVMNNPINLIDPDGMAPDTVIASNDLPDRSLNLSQDPNNNSKCECDLEKPQNVENESEVSINVTEDGNYEIEINGETRLTGSIRKIKRLLRKARINEETQQEALDDLSTMGKFRLNQRKLKTRRISKAEGLRINRELKSLSKQERRSAKKQDKNK